MSACGEYLSHAEGLNLLRGHVQGCYTKLASNGRTGSCPGTHLEVEAGQTDSVILLLFALSLLQQQKNTH